MASIKLMIKKLLTKLYLKLLYVIKFDSRFFRNDQLIYIFTIFQIEEADDAEPVNSSEDASAIYSVPKDIDDTYVVPPSNQPVVEETADEIHYKVCLLFVCCWGLTSLLKHLRSYHNGACLYQWSFDQCYAT